MTLKDGAAVSHPVEQIQRLAGPAGEQSRLEMLRNVYGSALPARMQIEKQILDRWGGRRCGVGRGCVSNQLQGLALLLHAVKFALAVQMGMWGCCSAWPLIKPSCALSHSERSSAARLPIPVIATCLPAVAWKCMLATPPAYLSLHLLFTHGPPPLPPTLPSVQARAAAGAALVQAGP